jgi:SWI/SNF-related matrix-associated actin-dependent regulator 1 of chromatin subfamily A
VVGVHGHTTGPARQRAVDEFQEEEEVQVFVGQIQAAGTGITLTAASQVLIVEQSWVPAENEQAIMRIHRVGQRNACLARFAVIPGSLDEQIAQANVRKIRTIGGVFA